MNELNKKLAEWVGFWQRSDDGWVFPDGKGTGWGKFPLPNFTKSLDACCEWLVPKLEDKVTLRIEFTLPHPAIKVSCYIRYSYDSMKYTGEGDTLALALCRTIEVLIDASSNEKKR